MNQSEGTQGSSEDPRADERPIVKLGDVVLYNSDGVEYAARVFHVVSPETGRCHLHVDAHDGTTWMAIDVLPGSDGGTWRARS